MDYHVKYIRVHNIMYIIYIYTPVLSIVVQKYTLRTHTLKEKVAVSYETSFAAFQTIFLAIFFIDWENNRFIRFYLNNSYYNRNNVPYEKQKPNLGY